jgi:hypothetical protein
MIRWLIVFVFLILSVLMRTNLSSIPLPLGHRPTLP